MLCYENVLTSCVALFLIYVEMFDRRFPCIAEISKTGRNMLWRFVIVQLVYVKRLCSLTFIWHVFCMNQGSTTQFFFFYESYMWPFLCKAKYSKWNSSSGQKMCVTPCLHLYDIILKLCTLELSQVCIISASANINQSAEITLKTNTIFIFMLKLQCI